MPNGTSNSVAVAVGPDVVSAPRPMGIAERHFFRAAIATAVIVLVFWCAWKVERDVLKRSPGETRFIREASEAAMRYITLPHVVIGFLFMASSLNNRSVRKRLWIAGLLLAGMALCFLFWRGGAKTNLFLSVGVYLYFIIHEMRDEAMFYRVLGDAAAVPDKAVFGSMVRVLIGLTLFALAAVAFAPAPFGAYAAKLEGGTSSFHVHAPAFLTLIKGSLPWGLKALLATAPLVLAAAGYTVALRYFAAKLGYSGVKVLVHTHAPLFRVLAGVTAVLGLSLLLTQRAYSLILFHVVAWYIFAAYQFSRNPPKQAPRGMWLWMRTTAGGFKTLHIGMVVVLMVIGLVWTLGLHQSDWLKWLLAPQSFLYWTIMHITVSFVPR